MIDFILHWPENGHQSLIPISAVAHIDLKKVKEDPLTFHLTAALLNGEIPILAAGDYDYVSGKFWEIMKRMRFYDDQIIETVGWKQ